MTEITIKNTPKMDAALVIVRYVLFAIGNIFIAKGWVSDSQLTMIIGGVLTAIPPVYGAFNAFTKKTAAVAVATGTPAQVVG